ncbi:hypothetical protein PVAP13_7KG212810 [Panicum virgatum]|uniref:Uncharacterized protein n=1 Tax=Panicum virgatum TaxID=38727 RepID=A0A8T0QIH2_PANVG|nr:hypothetical protein PVAP13_7KG212810 [Panicum virgatum]
MTVWPATLHRLRRRRSGDLTFGRPANHCMPGRRRPDVWPLACLLAEKAHPGSPVKSFISDLDLQTRLRARRSKLWPAMWICGPLPSRSFSHASPRLHSALQRRTKPKQL